MVFFGSNRNYPIYLNWPFSQSFRDRLFSLANKETNIYLVLGIEMEEARPSYARIVGARTIIIEMTREGIPVSSTRVFWICDDVKIEHW